MTNDSYKQLHESFMQNFNGTSALDTFASIVPVFFTATILKYVIVTFGIVNVYCRVCLEFLILVTPLILSTTVLSDMRLVITAILLLIFCYLHYNNLTKVGDLWSLKVQNKKNWNCITYIRALVFLSTIHCILAVDFNIFPRYMAKTEKYGYSLMDTGVGLFIFANALVPNKISKYGLLDSLDQNIKSCVILLILGYARTTIIKEINYHEHITEYGLHWNFFITLAITKFISTIILHVFSEDRAFISGSIVLIIHETLLYNGLTDWVYSNMRRDNFLTANREGITSCLGYIGLYVISAYIGRTIRDKVEWNSEKGIINRLFKILVISWITTVISNMLFGVSRCLANLGYCSYIIAIGTTVFTLFYLYELIEMSQNGKHKQKPNDYFPVILNAINRNGLLFFLIGNMVTGLINILFETLYLNTYISVSIIFLYMIFMITVIVSWNSKFIR